ncbi:hypothetical protein [Rouxiella sp. WC2420]|uniref:Uncharacterized protein n=1 Tax=Rouxiella sp. WC2420 TaxID=3234145 RepID=A0AB39VL38_9GAMM
MPDTINPIHNKYMASQQIIIELIRAGKISVGSADSAAKEINSLYQQLVDGYQKTHGR